jgi:hypothetical protein
MQPPTAAAAAWPLLTWPPSPTVAAPVAAPPIQPVTAPPSGPLPPDTLGVSVSSITYILFVPSIKSKKYTHTIQILGLIQVIVTPFFALNFSVKKITKYAKQIPMKQLNAEVFIM